MAWPSDASVPMSQPAKVAQAVATSPAVGGALSLLNRYQRLLNRQEPRASGRAARARAAAAAHASVQAENPA